MAIHRRFTLLTCLGVALACGGAPIPLDDAVLAQKPPVEDAPPIVPVARPTSLPPIDKTPYPEDCTIASDAPGPPLVTNPQGEVPVEVFEAPRQRFETIAFPEHPVRVFQGGCNHFTEEWTTTVEGNPPVWEAAKTMRERVQVVRPAELDACLKAIPPDQPTSYALGEIDGCHGSLEGGVLKVSYTLSP